MGSGGAVENIWETYPRFSSLSSVFTSCMSLFISSCSLSQSAFFCATLLTVTTMRHHSEVKVKVKVNFLVVFFFLFVSLRLSSICRPLPSDTSAVRWPRACRSCSFLSSAVFMPFCRASSISRWTSASSLSSMSRWFCQYSWNAFCSAFSSNCRQKKRISEF